MKKLIVTLGLMGVFAMPVVYGADLDDVSMQVMDVRDSHASDITNEIELPEQADDHGKDALAADGARHDRKDGKDDDMKDEHHDDQNDDIHDDVNDDAHDDVNDDAHDAHEQEHDEQETPEQPEAPETH